jgi:hypothetical protein
MHIIKMSVGLTRFFGHANGGGPRSNPSPSPIRHPQRRTSYRSDANHAGLGMSRRSCPRARRCRNPRRAAMPTGDGYRRHVRSHDHLPTVGELLIIDWSRSNAGRIAMDERRVRAVARTEQGAVLHHHVDVRERAVACAPDHAAAHNPACSARKSASNRTLANKDARTRRTCSKVMTD